GTGIESWYKEDNSGACAEEGARRISVMTEQEMNGLKFKSSSGYDATRSVFTYGKDVKELLRGGLENGDFLSLHWVSRWVNGSFMDTLPGMPRSVAKGFINRAMGLGESGMVSRVGEELAFSGREGQALRDAVRYVLNSESERRHLDSASQRIKRIAKVRCCELDGLVVERHPASTWEHIEEALGDRLAYKPYRPRTELLQTVAHAAGLEMLWPASFRWEEEEQYAIQ
ncbi:unnamed protein product, partial [Effrenium voratum]